MAPTPKAHAPRIIAGTKRGRRLIVPPDGVRPTKDRVKASVFSALDARGLLVDASVLDAYAGSAALAFEAVSRGAGHAVVIESDRAALAAIRANIDNLGLAAQVEVAPTSVEAYLARPRGRGGSASSTFDIVFLDPPYDIDPEALDAVLVQVSALAPGGILVVERPARGGQVTAPTGWSVTWERTFGDTLVQFVTSTADASIALT